MITNKNETVIVSSLGWCDKNCLWQFNIDTGKTDKTEITDSKYLSIQGGENDFFAISHHYEKDKVKISAHHFDDPTNSLSQAIIDSSGNRIEGNSEIWSNLPKFYIDYYIHNGKSDFFLFHMNLEEEKIDAIPLPWYNDSYDKGYQGIVGVVEIPNSRNVIISIQRDSHPVIFDPVNQSSIGKLSLAEGYGNPKLFFRKNKNELWAEDYDTLLQINPSDWSIMASITLQAPKGKMHEFIGDFVFNKRETLCAVARPFSGDVIALDTRTFEIKYHCELGSQPLEVSILSDDRIYSRDWKTGQLLKGTLKKIST